MDVEQPQLRVARVPEAVDDAGRRGDERARLGPEELVADPELGLAREHEERVDEVRMRVRVDALEVGSEAELDRFELRELAQDPVVPCGALDVLAAFRPQGDDGVHAGKYAPRRDRSGIRPDVQVVGIVSAGAMGSTLGARLSDGGARVIVALEARSERTRRRAADAGLEDVGSLAQLLREADVVLSVVPPGSAVEVAAEIAARAGLARPLVVDLNAVAPPTVLRIETTLAAAGLEAVDGSISGPPPHTHGTTRVYLSGRRAGDVAALPLEGVDRVVVSDAVGAASAVKMCTASVYKGRVALLAQALRTAHAHGVVEHVLGDLAQTGAADPGRAGATLGRASAKAWRYVAEMEEIATTQAGAGLTPELFRALATVYADLAERAMAPAPEDVGDDAELSSVLGRLSPAGERRRPVGGDGEGGSAK